MVDGVYKNRLPELRKALEEYDGFSLTLTFGPFPAASYLIYTRHHGFPSPLLDWTRSAYIAAFFAFAAEHKQIKRRSIYVWQRAEMRAHGTNEPELHKVGQYVRTHRRHVLQQCNYTICATYSTENKEWRFTPHEEYFTRDTGTLPPDRVWKFNLPSKERLTILKFLDAFNLNAYSLFGSDDSLMETLALRELDLHTRSDAPTSSTLAPPVRAGQAPPTVPSRTRK